LYSSPNIIRFIKSRRMRLAGHVDRKGDKRGAYWALVWRPGWRNFEDLDVERGIILKCILKK